MRFGFIEENRAALPTERLCQIMNVSSRGYRAYRSRPISQRQREDMVLLAHIREQHRLSLNSYGRPRMTEELKEIGLEVGHRRVGRLMRQNGISVEVAMFEYINGFYNPRRRHSALGWKSPLAFERKAA
jgi:putative transposase